MDEIFDTIIIGSGPAGLTAAVYAARAGLNFIVLEDLFTSGGQIVNTTEIDNFIGSPKISGYDLIKKFKDHAISLGTKIVSERVLDLYNVEEEIKIVKTVKNEYKTKTIIMATGSKPLELHIPGEEELLGMGVSYCATCDGAFYNNKITMVIGGGNTAVEDAIFLSRICKKVYLVHRKHELRADKILQDELLAKENVEVLWDTVVAKINGTEHVDSVILENNITNERTECIIDGLFIAIGASPVSKLLENKVLMASGYIVAKEDCRTSLPGVYAAGDIRTKFLRQVITAASDGANAITSVNDYLNGRT